jgi:hypothetical protein
MSHVNNILTNTITEIIKTKLCPICNNKLYSKIVFNSKLNDLQIKNYLVYDDCISFCTLYCGPIISDTIQLRNRIIININYYETGLEFCNIPNVPWETLSPIDFKDFVKILNKFRTFQ